MAKGTALTVWLAITLMTLLSSCSHFPKGDGAPRYHVDETRIPNAVPKPEPLAEYGNIDSYVVFGKRYHTMKSSQNYEQVGTASWYGTKFHARKTSSGEPYDMLKMTAAHKTLPLPTYVEVTNLKNNKRIIVKVNDRGPFASNRIIDLSYVAAKKLGMIGHGTALVRVKAIDAGSAYATNTSTSSQRVSTPRPSKPYLQVGAFQDKTNAQSMKHRLSSILATPVNIYQTSALQSLYYVKVGPFRDLASLSETSKHLQRLGINSNPSA